MVVLGAKGSGQGVPSPSSGVIDAESWVKAPEFVPGQKWTVPQEAPSFSYLEAAQSGLVDLEDRQGYAGEYEYPTGEEMPSQDNYSEEYALAGPGDEYALAGSGEQYALAGPGTTELCPYAAHGECQFGAECPYVHGDVCDLCGNAVLSPYNQEQREKHTE